MAGDSISPTPPEERIHAWEARPSLNEASLAPKKVVLLVVLIAFISLDPLSGGNLTCPLIWHKAGDREANASSNNRDWMGVLWEDVVRNLPKEIMRCEDV
jgi:hypothetical protein